MVKTKTLKKGYLCLRFPHNKMLSKNITWIAGNQGVNRRINLQGCYADEGGFSVDGANQWASRVAPAHVVVGLGQLISVVVVGSADANELPRGLMMTGMTHTGVIHTVLTRENVDSDRFEFVWTAFKRRRVTGNWPSIIFGDYSSLVLKMGRNLNKIRVLDTWPLNPDWVQSEMRFSFKSLK